MPFGRLFGNLQSGSSGYEMMAPKEAVHGFHCSQASVEHSATLLAVGCIGATASTSATAAA